MNTPEDLSKAPNPYFALAVYAGLVIVGLLSLKHAGFLFVPIFGGFIFAYLLNPLLKRLEAWIKIRRSIGAAVSVVTIFFSLTAILIPLAQYLLGRISAAADKLPQTFQQFSGKVEIFNQYLTFFKKS